MAGKPDCLQERRRRRRRSTEELTDDEEWFDDWEEMERPLGAGCDASQLNISNLKMEDLGAVLEIASAPHFSLDMGELCHIYSEGRGDPYLWSYVVLFSNLTSLSPSNVF